MSARRQWTVGGIHEPGCEPDSTGRYYCRCGVKEIGNGRAAKTVRSLEEQLAKLEAERDLYKAALQDIVDDGCASEDCAHRINGPCWCATSVAASALAACPEVVWREILEES